MSFGEGGCEGGGCGIDGGNGDDFLVRCVDSCDQESGNIDAGGCGGVGVYGAEENGLVADGDRVEEGGITEGLKEMGGHLT